MKTLKDFKNLWLTFGVLMLFPVLKINAQEKTASATDTIYSVLESVQSDVTVLKKLKITGYIQAQFQKADTIGTQGKFTGDDFKGYDNRFQVRRGRIKFAYDNDFSQYVLQFDVTEKGVGIKDAYAAFTDRWTRALTLTMGAFNRPFGYEIEYSSSSRETPERARVYQTLFNQERDLGAKLTIQGPKGSSWNWLKLDVGVFNGNALNAETDKYKDIIGRLSVNKTFMDESLKIMAGVSYYDGGYAMPTKFQYTMGSDGTNKVFLVDSTSQKAGDRTKRQYMGVDLMATYAWVAGVTSLRAEYITGTQPGGSGAYTSTVLSTAPLAGDTYSRKFAGMFVYFVQNIGNTPLQFVYKYDFYDPNTDISGNNIGLAATGKNKATGIADIKYTTNGVGLTYKFTANCKLTAYYDMVANETSSGLKATGNGTTDYTKQLKNNVWTLRLQYKF